jgi:hypothetical protein
LLTPSRLLATLKVVVVSGRACHMTIAQTARGATSLLAPVFAAGRLNVAAAVQVRRRGYSAWTGAVNTDYDPLDPSTAAQPYAAYDALHRGGRVHYNPRRTTWILHRLDDVRAALRGKSPGVVEFRNPRVTVPDLLSGVSLPGLGWAIA